jgi:hypothetical protein
MITPCSAVDMLATRHLVSRYEGHFVCLLTNTRAFLPVADDEHFKTTIRPNFIQNSVATSQKKTPPPIQRPSVTAL